MTKPINGLNNYYVTDTGIIFFDDGKTYYELEEDHYTGYSRVYLYGVGREYVHKIVANNFLTPLTFEHTIIFHIDGNNFNNNVSNLIFVTPAQAQICNRWDTNYRVNNMRADILNWNNIDY